MVEAKFEDNSQNSLGLSRLLLTLSKFSCMQGSNVQIFRQYSYHTLTLTVRFNQASDLVKLGYSFHTAIQKGSFTLNTYTTLSEKTNTSSPDTHKYVFVSGDKNYYFFGKFCIRTKWMIQNCLPIFTLKRILWYLLPIHWNSKVV